MDVASGNGRPGRGGAKLGVLDQLLEVVIGGRGTGQPPAVQHPGWKDKSVYKHCYPRFFPEDLEADKGFAEGRAVEGASSHERTPACVDSPVVEADRVGGSVDSGVASSFQAGAADATLEWGGGHDAAAKGGSFPSSVPVGVMEAERGASTRHADGLTDSDVGHLSAVLAACPMITVPVAWRGRAGDRNCS